jgi:hypothetical protein
VEDLEKRIGRDAHALRAEYRRTLEKEPRRFRSLEGAQRAAAAAGDAAAAARYERELAELTRH